MGSYGLFRVRLRRFLLRVGTSRYTLTAQREHSSPHDLESAMTWLAAETTVTGLPALLIILVVLALLIIGVVATIRFVSRKARNK